MWVFEITTGNMYDSNGKLVSKGYAGGNCGKNPEGINNLWHAGRALAAWRICDSPDSGPSEQHAGSRWILPSRRHGAVSGRK